MVDLYIMDDLLTTGMSQQVRINGYRINGLPALLIREVYWGQHNSLILTFDSALPTTHIQVAQFSAYLPPATFQGLC